MQSNVSLTLSSHDQKAFALTVSKRESVVVTADPDTEPD